MKLHFLIPTVFVAFLVISITACQKETQQTTTVSALASDDLATDRTYDVLNPCGNRQSMHFFQTAAKLPISTSAFTEGWRWGELDRIANDCVLGNTLPGNCGAGGMAVFYGIPEFSVYNFTDGNEYVTPQQQDRLIAMALAYATAHISSCGEGTSPKIYQIDFTRFPGSLFGYEYQFAVRYSCCPSLPTSGG